MIAKWLSDYVRCLVARRSGALNDVKAECISLGLGEDRILALVADVTSVDELVKVRDAVTKGRLSVLLGVDADHKLT